MTDELTKCRTDLVNCVNSIEKTMEHLVDTRCVTIKSLADLQYALVKVYEQLEEGILNEKQ